jgi:hypothetical protein
MTVKTQDAFSRHWQHLQQAERDQAPCRSSWQAAKKLSPAVPSSDAAALICSDRADRAAAVSLQESRSRRKPFPPSCAIRQTRTPTARASSAPKSATSLHPFRSSARSSRQRASAVLRRPELPGPISAGISERMNCSASSAASERPACMLSDARHATTWRVPMQGAARSVRTVGCYGRSDGPRRGVAGY